MRMNSKVANDDMPTRGNERKRTLLSQEASKHWGRFLEFLLATTRETPLAEQLKPVGDS